MRDIQKPHTNYDDVDEVLAQTVAGQHGWKMNDAGEVFDHDEVYIASGLTELASAMRLLGWFTKLGNRSTGVMWTNVPHDADDVSRQVRSRVRQVRLSA